MFNVSWGMCLVLFVMVRLAGANAFGSNRLQRYAYFSEWQYVDPKKILFPVAIRYDSLRKRFTITNPRVFTPHLYTTEASPAIAVKASVCGERGSKLRCVGRYFNAD